MSKHRILVTGAAGRIGRAFCAYVGDRYDLRLGVHHLSKLKDPGEHDVIEFDFKDAEACQKACKGIDVVMHIGALASPKAGFYGGVLESNIIGTYNIFRAAKDQRCQRVVYASSVRTVDGYPLDFQVHTGSSVRPMSLYGVSKCFGEALGHYFAHAEGLPCIAVRVGTWEGNWEWEGDRINARNMSTFVSERDMCQLLLRCVEQPDIVFAIVHGVSDNRFKRLDITSTKELLGYKPQDDAFKMFETGLRYIERWEEERKP